MNKITRQQILNDNYVSKEAYEALLSEVHLLRGQIYQFKYLMENIDQRVETYSYELSNDLSLKFGNLINILNTNMDNQIYTRYNPVTREY